VKQWQEQDIANVHRVEKISQFPNILRKSANYMTSNTRLEHGSTRKFNHTQMSSGSLTQQERSLYTGLQTLGTDDQYQVDITLSREEALVISTIKMGS